MGLHSRLLVHANKMDEEGWYVTANVLGLAAENLAGLKASDMTPNAFRKLRLAAGLTSQQAAAEFLHRSLRTIHGWENGEPIDQLAIDYLRLVVKTRRSR